MCRMIRKQPKNLSQWGESAAGGVPMGGNFIDSLVKNDCYRTANYPNFSI